MTLLEFEAWVSDNYVELCRRARQVTRSDDGNEMLHRAIEHILSDERRLPSRDPFALVYVAMRNEMLQQYGADEVRRRLDSKVGNDVEMLGEDAFVDTTRARWNRASRKRNRKKINWVAMDVSGVPLRHLLSGPTGDTRWIYQQVRDGRLFGDRAVFSLRESIRGVSARSLHGAGASSVHWGAESFSVWQPIWDDVSLEQRQREIDWVLNSKVRLETQPRRCRPRWAFEQDRDQSLEEIMRWTQISSSTGYHNKKLHVGMGSPHAFERCGGCGEHAITGRHDKACASRPFSPEGSWSGNPPRQMEVSQFIDYLNAAKTARAARRGA